ncbi:hypothetical protein ACH3XX_07135 [Streptomyces scabiei]|uniref:hypothetical protein n=1 Tax=Streptomyces scabiei TaxID=1930 RepID=UPI00379157BA
MSGIDLFEEFENDGVAEVSCAAMSLESGEQCGKPIVHGGVIGRWELSYGLPLCESHRLELLLKANTYSRSEEDTRVFNNRARVMHCYYVRLSDGLIKMGYTRSLTRRLKELTDELNGGETLEILSVTPGTPHLESYLHKTWGHLRHWDKHGERHTPDPELMEWISTLGIHGRAVSAVERYHEWAATPYEVRQKEKEQRNKAYAERVEASARSLGTTTDEDWVAMGFAVSEAHPKRAGEQRTKRVDNLTARLEYARKAEESKLVRIAGSKNPITLIDLVERGGPGKSLTLTYENRPTLRVTWYADESDLFAGEGEW